MTSSFHRRPLAAPLAAVVIAASVGIASPAEADEPAPAPPGVPTYADKPAAWWIERLGRSDEADLATRVIQRMGAAARPALVEAIGRTTGATRLAVANLLWDVSAADASLLPTWAALLSDPDRKLVVVGAQALARLGNGAAPAASALLGRLADPDAGVRQAVAHALSQVAPKSKEVVVAALDALAGTPDEPVRAWAHAAVTSSGPEIREHVPALLRLAKSKETTTRATAFDGLARARLASDEVVAAVVAGAVDPEAPVRAAALRGCAAVAATSAEAADVVVEALVSEDRGTRRHAVRALADVRKLAHASPARLRAALASDDPAVRGVAVALLGANADDPAATASILLDALAKDATLADAATAALTALGPSVAPALAPALAGPQPGRAVVAKVLRGLDPVAIPADAQLALASILAAQIRDAEPAWPARSDAVLLGARLGFRLAAREDPIRPAIVEWALRPDTDAQAVYVAVEQLTVAAHQNRGAASWTANVVAGIAGRRDFGNAIRLQIVGALGRLPEATPVAVQAIALYLHDSDPTVVSLAADTLARNESGRAILFATLGGGTAAERVQVVRALVRARAVTSHHPALARHLRDPDLAVRVAVAQALFDGEPLRSLLPADAEDLVAIASEAIERGDFETRRWALLRAQFLGSVAAAAVPALVAAFGDGDCARPDFTYVVLALDAVDRSAWPRVTFRDGLSSENVRVRAGCLCALAFAGEEPARVVAESEALLEHEIVEVRQTALRALGAVGPAGAVRAKDVAKRLASREPSEAYLAVTTLAKIAPDSPEACDAIVGVMFDATSPARGLAARTLEVYGARAVPALKRALADPVVRLAALDGLAALGAVAGDAVPALEAAVRDPDAVFARAARAALDKVRGSAK